MPTLPGQGTPTRAVLGVLLLIGAGCGTPGTSSADSILPSEGELGASQLSAPHTPIWVSVKYRSDPVDIAAPGFDCIDTSSSSAVGGACYDTDNRYLVINLNGTNYHYCRMPATVWASFAAAASHGSFFNSSVKGRYDCRVGGVPSYG